MRPGHGQVQVHFRNDFSRSFPNLPNFRRLIADGSWGPMLSTILCDTPTNWTAFATGATSGITGFAFHTPGESLREEGRPGNAADYEKARTAEFIWEAADRQGKKCLMVNYPYARHSKELTHGVIVDEETAGGLHQFDWGGDCEIEAMTEILSKSGENLVGHARRLAQAEPDWDMMFLQLPANDSQNHFLLGHLDPNSPLATPDSTRHAEAVFRASYIETDRILGEAARLAEEQGAIVVALSDHSAVPTHTWADTARPFIEKGWIHFDADGKWDPSSSKVRKMINHSIYVNLKGRQPDGIVEPEEYESVRDEVISTLLAMRDPRTGACPIALAARKEDLDGVGGNGPGFGDVIYLMRPGYSNQLVSEGAALTEAQLERFTMDPEEASETGYSWHGYLRGNHHDYLPNASYPGVCSNRAILLAHGPGVRKGHQIRRARTIDVTPTLAWWTGTEPPAQSEGQVLAGVFER